MKIEPFFFGLLGKLLFGCYHARQYGGRGDCGVVTCYPMGNEYVQSHRSYRRMADRLAAEGFPVLRFDFHGCGDSSGDCEEGRIDQWLKDIDTAMDEIRRRSGVTRICLVGFGLGGSLSVMHGCSRDDVDSIILLDPVVNGSNYLRELTTIHNIKNPKYNIDLRYIKKHEGLVDLMGFPIPNSVINDIGNMNLLDICKKPADNIFFVDIRNDMETKRFMECLVGMDVHLNYHFSRVSLWNQLNHDEITIPDRVVRLMASWLSEVYR